MSSWQNVIFAVKVLISVTMSAILIEDLTEFGIQMLRVLNVLLTEHPKDFMYVLHALSPVKLKERNYNIIVI